MAKGVNGNILFQLVVKMVTPKEEPAGMRTQSPTTISAIFEDYIARRVAGQKSKHIAATTRRTSMIPNRREMNLVFKMDLYSLVAHSFGFLEPGNRFIPAPYLELLGAALMQVGARAVRRLVLGPDARSENQGRGHLSQQHARKRPGVEM